MGAVMKVQHWIQAARPKTLLASLSPILLGSILAAYHQSFNAYYAGLTLICGVLIQVATNYANDYFDAKKGGDTQRRLGPIRATQAGIISEKAMKRSIIWIVQRGNSTIGK